MNGIKGTKRIIAMLLVLTMIFGLLPFQAFAAEADATLTASLNKAKTYIDGITINNSSNDPATVVKNFKTHFTWDNEKRENSKSYLFDWSYYNGVVFEGIEYVYEVTGENVYKDYVVEYMSNLIASNGTWAKCTNNTGKTAAGYNSTHGADCYKTASLLLDAYEMTGDNRYLTMAKTLYADLTNAANTYLLKNAGNNFRHTWASDPSPDLWLDGLYMILPFRAEYAKYIGDQNELNLIVSRMQWVSDNMYNSSRKLFYHAADSASSNSGTYWLRSIGWYAAAIVDVMDSMEGSNLEAMKKQLVKLVDGMKACQNASNGMWLNNMNASQSSSNPYETSGTALVCYAVMKAVNNGWLDESYADMAILAFNGICREKLSGSTLKDICFKGVPSGSNSTFYNNEGKGVGPFIMLYAELLEYVNKVEEEPEVTEPEVTEPEVTEPEVTEPEVTEPEVTEPEVTEPEVTEPEVTEPEATEPDATEPEVSNPGYEGTGYLQGGVEALGAASSSITSGTYYYLVNTKANKTLTNTASGTRLTMKGTQELTNVNRWYITHVSGNTYYVQYGGPDGKYLTVGNDSAALTTTRTALTLTYNSSYSCWDIGLGNYHLNDYRAEHNYASGYTVGAASDNGSRWAFYPVVTVTSYYELDTNGVDYGSEHKYLIVSNDKAVALKPNGSNTTTQAVTITNNIITDAASGLEWYFLRNTSKTGSTTYDTLITQNGNTWLYHTNSNMYIGNGADAHRGYWHLDNYKNGSYCFGDQDYNIWYLYHNGSAFTVRSNNTSTYVRLFKKVDSGNGEKVIFNIPAVKSSILPGEKLDLKGTVTVNGQTVSLSNCTIAWNSSNGAYATVSGGTVTGVASGNVTITATLSAVNGTSLKENIVLNVPVTVQGHDYKAVVTAPTCTTEGYTTHTCSICGDSYVTDKVAALGHTYKSVTVDPTCTKNGSITYTCACGHSYVEVIKATGHTYQETVTAPTCTEKGYTTHACACGDSYVTNQVAALGHTYKSVTVEATCTKDGSVTYTCHCGDSYVEVIEAKGHNYESVVTAPTCENEGYTTHTCTTCGNTYADNYVAALGHSYKTVVTAPTCENEGYTTHTCACGESYITDKVAALGHTYKSVTVDPTCTEDGSITYTCHCGDSYVEVIEAKGHEYEATVTNPTCTEKGYTTYTCDVCQDTYIADEVAALGHSYESVTVEATCTENGSITYTCHCGHSYVEVIQAEGHTYQAVITAPTCTEAGYTTYTCACGDTYVADEVAALGHSYETVTVAATCTENGSITHTCHCGDSYAEVIEAQGHAYGATVTTPTCTEGGYTTYTCACGDTYVADEVAALGHSYESQVTAPTCTESGFTTYTCHCGDTYVADEVSALGHAYESVTTAPTCTEPGFTTHTCHCGHSYVDGNLEAIGHSYTCVEENGFMVYTCDHCGDTHSEAGSWIAVTYARLSGEGIQTYGHDDVVTTETVLDKLSIQLSNDGVNISGTVAVTAEMVTWNQAFDGTIAGTYTANISYNGVNLGTITVTISGEHTYEYATMEATCTTGGSTINTCTDCGYSYENNFTTARGHNYRIAESNGYSVYTCNNCGDSYSEKTTFYTQAEIISAGNDYVITLYSGGKYFALSHANNSIAVVPVTVSNGEVISEITEDLLWTYASGKMSYIANGTAYYMYSSSNNWWGNWWGSSESTLSLSTSNSSTVSFSNNSLKVGSSYLKYSNNAVSLSSSATETYVFIEG